MINSTIKNATEKKQRLSTDPTAELKKIIEEAEIRTVFQPVIDLSNQQIVAYEAFSRGPAKNILEKPLVMFSVARESNLTLDLDCLCLKKALDGIKKSDPKFFFFINIEAETVFGPLWQILRATELDFLKRIVIEFTPRLAATDMYYLLKAITRWKDKTFRISIDGIGTEYHALRLIAKAKPDFIKIDRSLIRNIDEKETQRDFIGMFKTFANSIGAELVAEGIETIGEFKTLREIGVKLGQGFLIHPPHHKPSRIVSLIDF